MLINPVYEPIPPLENNKLLTNDGTDMSWTDTPTVAGLISTGVIRASDFAKTGWPIVTGATFSFSYPTFTVTDGGSAYYYIDGVKYTLSGNKTVNITDTEGLWYIYFNGATLTASQTIWSFRDEDKALVAYLHWDATNNKEIFLGWEAHTFYMDGHTHARLHYAGGARWETGLLVSDAGSETVNVAAGNMWDEDLKLSITDGAGAALFEQVLSPAELPIYYLDGASNWRIYETTDKANATDAGYVDGSNDLKYNKLNGTWANATVGLNNYVAYYVVATNEQTEPIALIMGQRVDNKLSDAKENNIFGGLTLTGLPFQEMVVLARLILKDTATYTLEEVLDLRVYNIKGNITSPLSPDHGGLAGLADDDHVQYLLADGTRTLTSLVLGANPSVISSANAIQIKPSGDTDDYLEFSTSSDIPRIGIKGGNNLYIVGDVSGAGIRLVSSTNYSQIKYISGSDTFQILSSGDIHLRTGDGTIDYLYIQTCGDTDDYIYMATANHVPTIGTVGACNLKITASSGEIDFDNENLSTTGDIAALTLSSDTFRSADESMSVAWGDTAAGSLVLDGDGDYVTTTTAPTLDVDKGSIAIWFKYNATVGSDGVNRMLFEVSTLSGANVDRISLYREGATHDVQLRYREASTNNVVASAVFDTTTGEDTWHLLVGTWDADDNIDLFIDGSEDDAGTETRDGNCTLANLDSLIIGAARVLLTQVWKGELSDAMIFNDELTSAEIAALYALGMNPAAITAGAGSAKLIGWWPLTADATDSVGTSHGTFVGNAYINSTLVIGLNTNDPLLVNGAFTVVGAGNVTGNFRVAGEILTTKVVGQGDLWLESSDKGASTNFVKSETINDHTTASAANISINNDVIEKSTSAKRDGLWKKHVALLEPDSSKFMQLRPSIFKSRHKNDDQDKLRFGLYAEEVGDVYPGVAVWEERDFLVEPVSDGDPPTVITERIIVNYDTRELIALMVAEIQAQEKRIEILEKRV